MLSDRGCGNRSVGEDAWVGKKSSMTCHSTLPLECSLQDRADGRWQPRLVQAGTPHANLMALVAESLLAKAFKLCYLA